MKCIKTGFHGYLEQYGEFIYGDAYAEKDRSGTLVLRICNRSKEPLDERLNLVVVRVSQIFDNERIALPGGNATLIAESNDWMKLGGYNGILFEVRPITGIHQLPEREPMMRSEN